MLSISGQNWIENNINKRLLEKIKAENSFDEIVARIIISRNFDDTEIFSVKNQIDITNPFLKNNDFLKSYQILNNSILNNDKIIIIGDYDVDGCVSTSLFVNFFKYLNINYSYHIPNRFKYGYGASLKLIKNLIKNKPKLVIMLDCGSNAYDSINYLNSKNIRSIVIDHHEIYKPYPKINCIINPKKECDYRDYDYFPTGVLTYFFLDFYIKKSRININLKDQLIYVLLSIVCDVMPLRKINRIIALNVLNNFDVSSNFLFNEVFKIKQIKRRLDIDDLGFLIGPLINSAGRLDDPNIVIELITNKNLSIKKKILNRLFLLNDKRKKIENIFFKNFFLKKIKKKQVLILSDKLLNEGIAGIIASRIKDLYNKPTIVLSKAGSIFKASARSVSFFNIGSYIKEAIDKKILIKGGGHNLAAGFTIKKNKLLLFERFINLKCSKKNKINQNNYISKISIEAINKKFIKNIEMVAPYGKDNSYPTFLLEDVLIINPKILKGKYLSFFVKSTSGKMVSGISFVFLESDISKNLLYNKNKMNLIVRINENHWNNKKNMQLIVLDIIKNPNIS